MTRVIVHAGFHKTGTTSLQDFLKENQTALAPFFSYYGKADFLQAGANARIFAQRPFYWRRLAFRRSFRRFLNHIPDAPIIVLSRETFSGVMPGHRDILGRTIKDQTPTAIILAREIVQLLKKRFGPQTEIEFLFTTRDRENWIDSIYGHLLRSIDLTRDREAFHIQLADLPAPESMTRKIAASITPVCVHTARLEEFAANPEGPAAAVLDLLNIPDKVRKRLTPVPRKNLGEPDMLRARFLELNRGTANKGALKAIKERILQETNRRSGI